MAKRKDSKALFEVIARNKDSRSEPGMAVPEWLLKRQQNDFGQKGAPAASGDEPPAPAVEDGPAPGMPPVPSMEEIELADATSEPILSSAGGRVRLSLNYVSFAAALLGAVVALGGTFYLGRVTGHGETTTQEKAVLDAPLRPEAADASAKPPAAPTKKYYLVIERLTPGMTPAKKADAEAIVKYLDGKGKKAIVREANQNQFYVVLSLEPFSDRTSPEAVKFAEEIEELGKAYRPPPGREKYNFSQHKDGRLDPSFIPMEKAPH